MADGYTTLATAILRQAVDDYLQAIVDRNIVTARECESFFKSAWGSTLSGYASRDIKPRVEQIFAKADFTRRECPFCGSKQTARRKMKHRTVWHCYNCHANISFAHTAAQKNIKPITAKMTSAQQVRYNAVLRGEELSIGRIDKPKFAYAPWQKEIFMLYQQKKIDCKTAAKRLGLTPRQFLSRYFYWRKLDEIELLRGQAANNPDKLFEAYRNKKIPLSTLSAALCTSPLGTRYQYAVWLVPNYGYAEAADSLPKYVKTALERYAEGKITLQELAKRTSWSPKRSKEVYQIWQRGNAEQNKNKCENESEEKQNGNS